MITYENLWAVILAGCSAFLLLTDAALRISALKNKAPDVQQNRRLDALEKWKESVDRKLDTDSRRFTRMDQANHVTMLALLALLDHGIDGNNIRQMEVAKEELNKHLVEKGTCI